MYLFEFFPLSSPFSWTICISSGKLEKKIEQKYNVSVPTFSHWANVPSLSRHWIPSENAKSWLGRSDPGDLQTESLHSNSIARTVL